MSLTFAEAKAIGAGQRVFTSLASICLPVSEGVVVALASTAIQCHAFSLNGRRFAAADQHGIIQFGYVPEPKSSDRQKFLEFDRDSFAARVARIYENDYAGPAVDTHMVFNKGWRDWKFLAIHDGHVLRFAAMDAKGVVEIWRFERCAWKKERVWQWSTSTVSINGYSSLSWNESGELQMTDNAGRLYRFFRKGVLFPRWARQRLDG